MKKVIYFIIIIMIIILSIVALHISNKNEKSMKISSFNKQFEQYNGKSMYGTDVLTIINRALDNNEEYDIPRDDEGFFVENNVQAVYVDLILLSKGNSGEEIEVEYKMEQLEKVGLEEFVASFNLTAFHCETIEYNSEGRVNRVVLKQLEI